MLLLIVDDFDDKKDATNMFHNRQACSLLDPHPSVGLETDSQYRIHSSWQALRHVIETQICMQDLPRYKERSRSAHGLSGPNAATSPSCKALYTPSRMMIAVQRFIRPPDSTVAGGAKLYMAGNRSLILVVVLFLKKREGATIHVTTGLPIKN